MDQLRVFDDFHLASGFAPDWHERYLQMSAGAMKSRLTAMRVGSVQVFRKWMSERVVQQGALPAGRLCFAMPLQAGEGVPGAQGRELPADGLLVLRAGEEFTLQRPRGMELMTVTLDAEALRESLDARAWSREQRALLARPVLRLPAPVRRAFQLRVLAETAGLGAAPLSLASFVEALGDAVSQACGDDRSIARMHAEHVVSECHRLVAGSAPEPVSIDALCTRLRVSRRTLQNSFRSVADASPLEYLRAVRLNAVRARLRETAAAELSVSQAAADHGFDHLGHFGARYRTLFAQKPSDTPRARA